MKVMLNVSFADKEDAKRLGCKFSGADRRWYIEDPDNIEPFMKWMPSHLKAPHKTTPPRNNSLRSTPKIGQKY